METVATSTGSSDSSDDGEHIITASEYVAMVAVPSLVYA